MPKSIASTAAPDLPHDVDLPTEYKAKRCKWCKNWSSSLCPWPLQNTVLSAWSPLLPWHRGSRNKPIGDACKVCMVVWTQGGYEAEYAAEERFHKCCDSNPTLLHSFLDKRSAVIRMKKADPNMRFRVETNLGPAMSLTSSKSSEQGLEAPEVFWVELSEYEQEFGAANPDDIVVETVDGKTVQGVNVMTGRKGWYRRINKSSTQVKRSAEFSDGVAIDDGAGMDKLEQAIKKATLKSTKIAKVATFHHTGSAGSTSDCRVGAESHRAHDESHEDMHAGESDPDRTNDQSDDSDDDMPGVGLSNFLKSFNAASSSRSLDAPSSTAAPKSKAAAKPKAASVKAKAKHSGPAASSSDGASQKVAVGNAGTVSSKRKVVVVDPFVAGGDDASTSPEKKKLREVDDLTEADANTVQTFNSKLDPLKLVGPPIADAAFKTYMTDQIQKATQLITELRIKKKSADRRNGSKTKTNKADIMFLEKLTEVETEVKEVQKLLRCLAGQISLDADRTLLQALDEAASKRNMSFNSSVIRKALKIAMYDNLKLCQFNEMANETYELISARFITDDDNTNVTSDDFYSMVCGQVLQKLAKTAQSKVRSKEPIFAPCNKKETSLMDQFFTALVSSSKIPTSLGGDAQDLLNLLKAEVNSVTAVRVSLDKMNQQTNSDASNGPLSGMLLGTTLGTKLVGDAQLALEARSVDTEMTENLERIFAELPTMYSNLEGCDESTIKAKCSSLSEAHNTLIEFMKNKQRVKSLGKDGLSKKQTSLRNAAALLMMHSAIHDVKPWLTDASAPMTSTQLISELTCKAVQDLIKLQDFATLKAVMSSSSALSKALVTIKSQTGDDSGSTSALNIALSTFTIAVKNFEAYFTKSAFSASLPNDVKVLFADTNVFTVSLNIFLERMNEKDINRVLRALGQSLKTLCDGEVSEKCIADTNSAIERLQLSAAALPHDSMHRVPALQSADFLIVFVKAAGAHKSCNTSKPEDASMKILVKSMAELNSHKSLKDTVNMVISTIGNGASNDADKTLLPTAEMLVTTIESLMTSYSALEKTWVDIMVAEMDTIMTKIDGYKIPNTKNIEYTPSDTNTLPSLQNDFPELNDLDPNSAALVQVAADLRSLLGRVKDVGLVEKVEPYTKASSAHTNSLTALAIIAIVKVFQIKRFRKAVEAKQPIPQNLLESLADTMQTCKDVSPPLEIPPALQAQVSSFSNKASSGAGQQP